MLARSSKFTVFCLVIIGYHLLNLQAFTITGQCSQSCSYLHDNTIADCRARGCTGLPEDLPPTVTDLDLSLNNFDVGLVLPSVIRDIRRLTNLTKLNLAGSLTGYSHLNGSMFAVLPKLKHLNINYADILSIGRMETAVSLTHLYVCELTKTRWNMINDSFPRYIEELDLSGNTITDIRLRLRFLTKLTKLIIRDAAIPAFAVSILPPNLHFLDLSYNRKWPLGRALSFDNVPMLETLRLSYSNIRIDSRTNYNLFKHLTNLVELHLDGNCISWIPNELFRNTRKLKVLNLSGNALSGWDDDAFNNIEQPRFISFAANNMEIIYNLPRWTNRHEPLFVDFTDNYLNCICDTRVKAFVEWLEYADKYLNKSTSSKCTCYKPPYLKGQLMTDVMDGMFDQCAQPWWSVVLLPAIVLVSSVLVGCLSYRNRWYIRWFLYRCCFKPRTKRRWTDYGSTGGNNAPDEYHIYLSYARQDEEWAEMFVRKVAKQPVARRVAVGFTNYHTDSPAVETSQRRPFLNASSQEDAADEARCGSSEALWEVVSKENVRDAITQHDQQADAADKYTVYAELCSNVEGGWEIEQIGKAIFSSRNVIIVLSSNYLYSSRHLFELHVMQQAMVERYGYSAHSHITLVAIEDTTRWMHLLPSQLRSHFNIAPLTWNDRQNIQQNVFWNKLYTRLRRSV
jgi:hypothetical protein